MWTEMQLGGEEFFYRVADGTYLSGRDYGISEGGQRPVICLPGLTRNVRDFDALARFLSETAEPRRRVVSFDYRGRGQSGHADPSTYTPQVEAGDVLAGMTARGIEEADFIGTSRGGLICMALGAMRPGVLRKIILNDIGPVIHVNYLAGIKEYVSGKATPASWEQAEQGLKTSLGSTFTSLTASDRSRLARQLYDERDGRPALAFDTGLAAGLDVITDASPPVSIWPYFATLSHSPILVLRGMNSSLLDQETVHEMARRHKHLEVYLVPNEGHAPLLWDASTQNRILRFLRTISPE